MEYLQGKTEQEILEEKESTKKMLISSYKMYENSIEDMLNKRSENTKRYSKKDTDKSIKLIKTMQDDIVDRLKGLGLTEDDIKNEIEKSKKNTQNNKELLNNYIKKENEKDEMIEYIENMKQYQSSKNVIKNDNNDEIESYIKQSSTQNSHDDVKGDKIKEEINKKMAKELKERDIEEERLKIEKEDTFGNMKQDINKRQMFGIVKLPSGGECYKHKIKELRVSYLTAYDENMILSPNLYKEGDFLEYIAKTKIIDNINVDELCQGDIEAVIIWLRGTGYGNEYPIIVTDPDTKKEFETTVDLTTLKYKKFDLKGDENGYFDFTTPINNDKIKFKILTNGDIKFLKKLKIKESKKLQVIALRKYSDELLNAIKNNDLVDSDLSEKIEKELTVIHDEIISKYNPDTDMSFTHELTDRLILQTISINGITDRKYINDYIISMNIKDASEYRKYVIEHTPGVEYNIKVERPKSLGGGSVDTFLQFDQFILVNF